MSFRYVNQAPRFGRRASFADLDVNIKRTYNEHATIKEARMHPFAAHALRDVAEIAALGAFLIMIALIARALGS